MAQPTHLLRSGIAVQKFWRLAFAAALSVLVGQLQAQLFQNSLVSHIAGPLEPGSGSDDGPVSSARFFFPNGVAADSSGTVFVADTFNHVIRRIDTNGIVSTIAGLKGVLGTNDGVGTAARFTFPKSLVVLPDGDLLVNETSTHVLRRVKTNGLVSVFAGIRGTAGTNDGSALQATFNAPYQATVLSDGSVAIADRGNHTIRKVSPMGVVSTIAGRSGVSGTNDGPGLTARFQLPIAIASDGSGGLWVAETANLVPRFRRIAPDGTVSSTSLTSRSEQGPLVATTVDVPVQLKLLPSGDLVFTELYKSTLWKMSPLGTITNLSGAYYGNPYFDGSDTTAIDGRGYTARFFQSADIEPLPDGRILVADTDNHQLRVIGTNGFTAQFAGLGRFTGTNEGVGVDARFYNPVDVAADLDGNLYVTDSGNHTIRKISAAGLVTTLTGSPGNAGDTVGTGPAARFNKPTGIAFGPDGNLYGVDQGNRRIKRIGTNGVVSNVNNPNDQPFFFEPSSIAIDSNTNLFVASEGFGTLWRVSLNGTVTQVSGLFGKPRALVFGPTGDLLVADAQNNLVRRIGTNGTSSVLVPDSVNPNAQPKGTDGPSPIAGIGSPNGILALADGTIIVSSTGSRGADNIRIWSTNGMIATLAGRAWDSQTNYINAAKPKTANGASADAGFGRPGRMALVPNRGVAVVDGLDHSIRLFSLPGVGAGPVLLSAPVELTNLFGNSVVLRFAANAPIGSTIRWLFNGTNLSSDFRIFGVQSTSLSISNLALADSGVYSTILSNQFGSVTGQVATLFVQANPPSFTPLQSTTVAERLSTLTLSSSGVSGSGEIGLQWSFNGAPIAGATGATLKLRRVDYDSAGSYVLTATNFVGTGTFTNNLIVVAQRIGEAVEAPELTWISSASAASSNSWILTTNQAWDGVDSLRTGPLGAADSAALHARLEGPGLLKFLWRITEAAPFNILRFTNDFNQIAQASLLEGLSWKEVTISIPAGPRIVSWILTTPFASDDPGNAGWLDNVRFYSTATPPTIAPYFAGIQTNGTYGFRLTGIPSSIWEVEASTNLTKWESLGLFTNVTGQTFFSDASNTNRPNRFYRLKQLP